MITSSFGDILRRIYKKQEELTIKYQTHHGPIYRTKEWGMRSIIKILRIKKETAN